MLNEDPIKRRREEREREEELSKLSKTHTCAECNAPLVMPWSPEQNQVILVCGRDRSHQGYRRGKSLVQAYKDGDTMGIAEANAIEKKLGGKRVKSTALTAMKPEQMLARIDQARFPQDLTVADKKVLAEVAIGYGFDPLMGELMIYQSRAYVTIDGRRRKAQETNLFDGISTRPATPEERKAWGITEGDYFFHADVYKKDCTHSFEGWGRVRQVETKAPASGRGGFRPLEVNPQQMAEKRAEAQALRKAFSIPLPSAEDIGSENGAIEGEYRVVDVKTGEIQTSELEVPSEGHPWLTKCHIHHVAWEQFPNRYTGGFTLAHKTGEKDAEGKPLYCKASAIWGEEFSRIADDAGFKDVGSRNDWLKKHFGGRTWSKMEPTEYLDAIEKISQLLPIGQDGQPELEMEQ